VLNFELSLFLKPRILQFFHFHTITFHISTHRFGGIEAPVSKSQPTSLARRIGGSQPYYTPVQRTPQHQLHHPQQHHQPQPVPSAVPTTVAASQPLAGVGVGALYAGNQPPTPSPRRKLSNSSFGNPNPQPEAFQEFRVGGGIGPPPLYAPADYLRNGPSYSNDGGNYRNGYFGRLPKNQRCLKCVS